MPDNTITATQRGVYGKALVADTPQSVLVTHAGRRRKVRITSVTGASPIYVGRSTLAAKAQTAIAEVLPGASVDVNVPSAGTLWVVSAAVGSFSVRKL